MSSELDTGAIRNSSPAAVLDRVDEAIYALDTDWQFEYINDRAAEILERDPDSLLGETIWDAFPAVADTEAYETFRDAMDTGEPARFDMQYEPWDAWYSVRAYPDADGITICFYDVTDERGQQLELQRKQRLFETVFEDTDDALVIADPDGRLTELNPAAERLFGYDDVDTQDESLSLLYADENEYERRGERRDSHVAEYQRADGTTFEGETVATPLDGPNGEALAFLTSIRDVSARIEYEERMQQRNAALRSFHEITTDSGRSFERRLTAVLELCCDHLDLDVGRLVAVDDDEYTVEASVSSGDSSAPGDAVTLDETFCEFVVDADRVVSFDGVTTGEVTDHTACQDRGVESYLGAPVVVDGDRYGTLSFSRPTPRGEPFTESDETFARVLAQWVGKELSRRRQRERARASRRRLRQIIDMLPQLVFAKKETGEFLLANEAVAEAYGTTVADLEGSTDADFADSQTEADQFRRDDRAVIESGEPKHIPAESLTTADGERRVLETTKIPYDPVDADGHAVLGVSTDITEREAREVELEVQSAAMEASMDGISILNTDGEYISMNEAHAAVFDYDPAALIGSSWRRLYDADEVERIEETAFPTLERAGEWRGETVGMRRDGSPVYQEITLSLLDDGKLICTNRDITARKQREQELERYEALVESMDEAALVVDSDGRIEYANKASASYTGATVDDLAGRSIETLAEEMTTNDEDPDRLVGAVEATLDGGTAPDRLEVALDLPTRTAVMEYQPSSFRSDGRRKAVVVAREVTERRARERKLERQRSRTRALFDDSPDSIIVHDADGAIVDANETQVEMLGYDRETLLSMNVSEFEVGLSRADLRDVWADMSIGETLKTEGKHRQSNGLVCPVEVWIAKTEVDDEPRFVAVSRDISERKTRELELERNREFLEKTQESAAIGGWEIEFGTGDLQWTDEVYRIHDLPLDADPTLADGFEYVHHEDRPTVTTAFEQLRTEGESYDLEVRVVTADDDVRWVRTIGDPQFDGAGEVVGALGTFQDITERKEREQDLRELTERLDLAVEGANLGVWDWNVETDAIVFNEQWARMLELSPDDIEPTFETWKQRVHPADTDRVEAALEAHVAGETELYDCEHRMQTASGDWKWIRDVGRVVERDADDEPVRAVGIHLDVTDQKETETSLEEERDMFAQGPAVVFKWQNADGWPIEYVSDNVTETFGYTPAQLESGDVPYMNLVHDDDLERVAAKVEGHSDETTERFGHDPYRMVTAEGAVRWVKDHTKIIRNDGEVTHYLGYLIDITERKELEQSLRDSERSLREVTEIASDTERAFQPKLEAILELGCERLDLSYGFLNRIDEDTQHVVEATGTHPRLQPGESAPLSETYCRNTIEQDTVLDIADAAAGGWEDDPAHGAFELGCYIGGKIIVEGDVYGTLCFADDDSRAKTFDETERAFVELLVQWLSYELESNAVETKLRELNETAQRLLATGDADEVGSAATESASAVLDLPITGVWWYEESADALVPAGMTDEAAAVIDTQPTFDGGGSLAWEAFADGETRLYNDVHAADEVYNEETPMRSEVIVPLGEHGVLISGSRQQRAFSETDRELLEILSATVEDALNRAEREQVLRETRERLTQSNQDLEQFAYAASHDLQEPLRTISSYLTLLERRHRDDLSGDALEFIDIAVDGADRMREMIQALLAYSRVGTRGDAFEPTDMATVFEAVTRNLSVTIEEADATVDVPEDEAAGTVVGDQSQLVQLFQNLVENGIKYSEDDPRVEVSVERNDEALEFAVTDNGIGIAPDQVEDIFEVFQRLHTRAEFEGTGIGLSLCQKIVDRHGGDIRVESSLDTGSIFFITLPVEVDTRD
ncbi:PAS domain S-box protein [Halorientalis sp.]|uniref:PAS domain S-box protein n=1 Tax=Halorientalis sp. TaxID=1931229 RepID=UPI0026114E7D|nr:PAS domain S-box protein [Halorientalis sp.]